MKIPKRKACKAISEEGVEYLKMEDIRYPLLSYILTTPLRLWRKYVLIRRINTYRNTGKGGHSHKSTPTKPAQDLDGLSSAEIIFGDLLESPFLFSCRNDLKKRCGGLRTFPALDPSP